MTQIPERLKKGLKGSAVFNEIDRWGEGGEKRKQWTSVRKLGFLTIIANAIKTAHRLIVFLNSPAGQELPDEVWKSIVDATELFHLHARKFLRWLKKNGAGVTHAEFVQHLVHQMNVMDAIPAGQLRLDIIIYVQGHEEVDYGIKDKVPRELLPVLPPQAKIEPKAFRTLLARNTACWLLSTEACVYDNIEVVRHLREVTREERTRLLRLRKALQDDPLYSIQAVRDLLIALKQRPGVVVID